MHCHDSIHAYRSVYRRRRTLTAFNTVYIISARKVTDASKLQHHTIFRRRCGSSLCVVDIHSDVNSSDMASATEYSNFSL